jgi:hypothetical protein
MGMADRGMTYPTQAETIVTTQQLAILRRLLAYFTWEQINSLIDAYEQALPFGEMTVVNRNGHPEFIRVQRDKKLPRREE